jgi:hypothetical protein
LNICLRIGIKIPEQPFIIKPGISSSPTDVNNNNNNNGQSQTPFNNNNNSVALFRERTIATERLPLVCEDSANFCG